MNIAVQLLGQSGVRFDAGNCIIYVDPYLSHSVEENYGQDMKRLSPIWKDPAGVNDANYVLITHDHMDHCDPQTIPKVADASPQACFIAPKPVMDILLGWGISPDRIQVAEEEWIELSADLRLRAVPAAHPEIFRDEDGLIYQVGYLLEYLGKRIYIAGDTFVQKEIIDTLFAQGPIHTAFLPVNEHNYFKERSGITGNMSIREAFRFAEEIGVKQVVPVHWDMFAVNSVDPEEIRFIYNRLRPNFDLLIHPKVINISGVDISIIIRTLNEAKYLDLLLTSIGNQQIDSLRYEVIIVDSGSTDATLQIAQEHECRILNISRHEFSFGRSLNIGCNAAKGEILVIISGHCVPVDVDWLAKLCQPLLNGQIGYTYGKQIGGEQSHFSEKRIFAKYYPDHGGTVQSEFFCNNANSAIRFTDWKLLRFDEDLTGLEDMELAQRLVKLGGEILYVPNAVVYHYHEESWSQVQRRFEREAIALQRIMPQVHVDLLDLVRYTVSSILKDWRSALSDGVFIKNAINIVLYRWHQYLGVYYGNNDHRRLSHAEKDKYFYPN